MTDPRPPAQDDPSIPGSLRAPRAQGERKRRESPLLARSPVFAVVALAVCVWMLFDMWPDVAFFLSPRSPIALGTPGAYHLELARQNRLVNIVGPAVAVRPFRRGTEARTAIAVRGTNLLVDRRGTGGPDVYEGRLLPAKLAAEYAPLADLLRQQGWAAGDRWYVLRDGERPRSVWGKPLLSAVLVLLVAVNLRALLRNLLL